MPFENGLPLCSVLTGLTSGSVLVHSELKANLRKIEHEHADLKFLNNQYVHKMKSLEQESKQKTERILQLQEKNFHAVVQTPGLSFQFFLCSN